MSDPMTPIRLVIDNAQEVPPLAMDDSGTDTDGDGRRRGGGDDPPTVQLPDGCPVTPLGILDDNYFYLDATNQLRKLPAQQHTRLGVMCLFGARQHLLEAYWPTHKLINKGKPTEEWIVTGFKAELAQSALMTTAARCGVWNPVERVRGRGAWLGDDGKLLMHCGDVVYDGTAWHDPGLIDRHVYPAGTPTLRPASGRFPAGRNNPAEWLLAALKTWNWRRRELDALLLLGWIAASMLGGALDWRPLVWITGGSGTGKSTLHKLIGRLFDAGLVQVSDTSSAGIWQKLGHSSLPVNIDEQEAEEDNRKANAVVKLARLAASGAVVLRGGADHNSSEFTARSCFMFSSILIPPLLGQDRNRIAILELGELQGAAPDLEPVKLREVGTQILRRLVDGWGRLPSVLQSYQNLLRARGHSARGADVFGTLLACADILLNDEQLDSDSAAELAEKLDIARLAEVDDEARDEERCLHHLLSSTVLVQGGMKRSIAEWIERAASDDGDDDWRAANSTLGTYGIKVLRRWRGADLQKDDRLLAIANYHTELAKLFDGSHWAGRSGTMGVWVQALRRLPGAQRSEENIRFASTTGKATLMPITVAVTEPDGQDLRGQAVTRTLPHTVY